MSTRKRNFFDILADDCDDDEMRKETNDLERKAKKKIREIEKLKKKKHKTPEEHVKISEESYWMAIAAPVLEEEEVPGKRDIEREIRQEKQYDKTKNDYERKLRIKENEHAKKEKELQSKIKTLEGKVNKHNDKQKLFYKTISEQEKTISQQAKTISQQCREIDELRSKINSTSSLSSSSSSIDIVSILDEEMNKLRKAEPTSSPIKIWRKMARKYHPDKLSNILGTNISTEISKILNDMKPEC